MPGHRWTMPQFKGQKKYVPGKAVVKNTNTAAMADDLGFDDGWSHRGPDVLLSIPNPFLNFN